MTYTGDKKRQYDLARYHRVRRAFFEGKLCVRCGSDDQLELDHINPAEKITNSIWSWSKARREAEIAKCQILCKPCNLRKQRDKGEWGVAKVTWDQVREMRRLHATGVRQRELVKMFGIGKTQVSYIINNKSWKEVIL